MRMDLGKKRIRALGVSYTAAAFLVTGGFAVREYARAKDYENTLNNVYQHAFAELSSSVSELNNTLQKLSYATSPTMISSLCTELFGRAVAAQMSLGELPYGNVELEHTASFLAKVGDYAAALSKSAAINGACSDEERQNLRSLSSATASLAQMLSDLEADIHSGAVTMQSLNAAKAQLSAASEEGGNELSGASYQSIESEFPEVPSLVYDGPFSEHLSNRMPKSLEDKEEVTQDQALAAAAQFLQVKPEILSLTSTLEGNLPGWGFSSTIEGGEVYLEVARKGGTVVQVINSRPAGEAAFSAEEATEEALTFLKNRGYENLAPSYYINKNNILTINLAAKEGEVLLYPDLIKVSVALDTCRVIGFEAKGYLMNHVARDLPQPSVDMEEARAKVDGDLQILSHQLALIPTSGEYEVLCYEFKCQDPDGKHYLFYINTQTGREERILLLLEDESGTLVI